MPRTGPALPENMLEQDAEDAGKGGKGPPRELARGHPAAPRTQYGAAAPTKARGQLTKDASVGAPSKGSLSSPGLTGQHPSLGSKGLGPNTAKTQKPVAGALYQRI